jgi:hypothetical protein
MAEKATIGCYYAKDKKRWIARIKINNEMLRLGQFLTEKEAAQAYDYVARKLGRELNFPEKSIPKAVREAVKPKIAKFKLAEKVDEALSAVDQKIWNEGEFYGVQWAMQNKHLAEKTLALKKKDLQFAEAATIADTIGCGADYENFATGKNRDAPVRNKNSQLAFVRAFYEGARRYFQEAKTEREAEEKRHNEVKAYFAAKRAEEAKAEAERAAPDASDAKPGPLPASLAGHQAPIVQEATDDVPEAMKESRMHFSQLLAELQAKAAARKGKTQEEIDDELANVDIGEQVPGTVVGPNGEIWSADCNPETLARDNAAIAKAQRERTGIFAMMDRDKARKREIDELLDGIV